MSTNQILPTKVGGTLESLLTDFFSILSEKGINYAVMRNAENLPARPGRDLDIIVHPDHRQRLETVVVKTINEHNGWLALHRRGVRRLHMNASFIDGSLISFDIQWDISFHKMVLSDAAPLLEKAIVDSRGFRLLAPPDEAATAVINGLLGRTAVKPDYQIIAHNVAVSDAAGLQESFNSLISPQLSDEFLDRCKKRDWSRLSDLKFAVVNKLRQRLKSGLLTEINARIRRFLVSLKGRWGQRGPFVVLLGTHGAGKTTTALALKERFNQTGFRTKYHHINSRPGVLGEMTSKQAVVPIAPRDSARAKYSALPHIEEKKLNLAQRLKATGRLLYHALDFFVFHWRIVKPALRRGEGVVCDRYLYDYLVEPRGVAGSPYWLRKLLGQILPKPDLLVHLKADPKVIYTRKAELPLEVLRGQIAAFDLIVEQNGGVSVSVDQPIDMVCRELLTHLGPVQTDRLP